MFLQNRSFRCNLERERCQGGDLTLDVEYEDECDTANGEDDIEFEAIEADEYGDSEDSDCSGQRFFYCKKSLLFRKYLVFYTVSKIIYAGGNILNYP